MDTELKKFKIKATAVACVVIAAIITWSASEYLLKKQCAEQHGDWSRGACTFVGKAGE